MTEIASVNSPADFQHGPTSPTIYAPPPRSNANGYSPTLEDAPADEDSSTIRCFCEYNEDDGNTVLCEDCNTWQHIQCYYPTHSVPDLHVCVICRPRAVDRKGAVERQRQARILLQSAGGKIKKPPAKSHKKKIRDPNQAAQANGLSVGSDQAFAVDRSSVQDQPPPAKRTKTSHRSSSSTSALINPVPGQSRKRATSTALGAPSPVKSPRSPSPTPYSGEQFSAEFMRTSQSSSDYTQISTNSFSSLDVSDDLQTWLHDGEALREVAPGLTQHNVFQRWDRPMEELKHQSPSTTRCKMPDLSVTINGQHPVHNWMIVNNPCGPETYLGELNGQIGRVDDYTHDPRNRWSELRHPEPFVFFLDKLPIYIDCREEGSDLRYVRRSCQPNAKIQIIMHGTDFHFCFVSIREIAPQEEITLPWSIRGKEFDVVRALGDGTPVSREDEANMAQWFTRVVANFGGCACSRTQNPCAMARFDIRSIPLPIINGHPPKPLKQRKTKKGAAHVSPLSTGRATNSRANSEAINRHEIEDDDSRSVSNSSRSKPSSRDITPNMNDMTGLGVGMELSDRERRKLLQQERLFEKMEEEKGGKKKRNSAGLALSTPSLSVSKQLGFPDSSNPSPTSTTGNTRPRTNGTAPRMSVNGVVVAPRKRPAYNDAGTQTEAAKEEPPNEITLRRRAQGSYAQRLLWRVREESRRRKDRGISVASQEQKHSMSPTEFSAPIETKTDCLVSPVAVMLPPPVPASATVDSSTSPIMKRSQMLEMNERPTDVEMVNDGTDDLEIQNVDDKPRKAGGGTDGADADADADADTDSTTPKPVKNEALASPLSSPVAESAPMARQLAPPWDSRATPSKSPSSRPAYLHVTLPSLPAYPPPSQTETTPTPGANAASLSVAPIAQSPSSLQPNPPLFSPSIQNAVAPSPMKKKLSLSDYTKRKSKSAAQAQASIPCSSTSPSSALAHATAAPMSASPSPTEEKKMPTLQQANSSVLEEVDMPLARMRPADEDGTLSPNS